MKIANNMLELVGNIPLVRLNRIGQDSGCEILVKPEFLNPSGSIKDRIIKYMIEAAERGGTLRPGHTIVEASTGNTAAALSFVGAVKGYPVVIYGPARTLNPERAAIILAYGAQINKIDTEAYRKKQEETDSSVHGGAIEMLPRQLCLDLEQERDDVWWARQFSNEFNVAAHREWTAREILEQTDGCLDAFVASVGTGGTLLGAAQALKAHDENILIAAAEPAGSPMLSGAREDYPIIEGITDGIILDIFDSGLADRVFRVTDQEAIDMAHQLAEKEGIFCGISSGANVHVAVKLAQELGPGKRLVAILPDSRDRYLATEMYTT